MIRPRCRLKFTSEDFTFIASVLCSGTDSKKDLAKLLLDPESLDILLDDEKIVSAVLNRPECLKISTRLYFYILVRYALKNADIDDTTLADYIAELLSEYAPANRAKIPIASDYVSPPYFTDILQALEHADDKMRFFIHMFVGNYTLFLSGIFPGHIRHRTERRAAPKIQYYEALGSSHYRDAGHHQLARKYELTHILLQLSESFHNVRVALNRLPRQLIVLESPGF